MTAPNAAVLDRLKAIVGPAGAIDDPAEMAPYVTEWRDKFHGRAALVLKPASVAEVSAILALCHTEGVAVVPQGGNTGLVGGGVPFEHGDEIVVSLVRLNRIRTVDRASDTITVEAGCVLANVQAAAAEVGRLFPMRIGSEGSCQIGGNLATNAGGTAVLRYGTMRDLVLGLEVVLPDGRVWDGLKALCKDNTGYDLKQLFIGAEGTLGILTAAVLKLYPAPDDVQTALVAVAQVADAVTLFGLTRDIAGDQVTGFELIPRLALDLVLRHIPGTRDPLSQRHPWYVLIELSAGHRGAGLRPVLEHLLERGLAAGCLTDAAIADSTARAAGLWHLRDSISEAQKLEGGSIKHDVSVPISAMARFIAEADRRVANVIPGFRSIAFGHIGDGNVHYNPMQPLGADREAFLANWQAVNRVVHDLVDELAGSISAEHGLGRLKRDEITRYKSETELGLMRAVKRALDPKNILNPGKVIGG